MKRQWIWLVVISVCSQVCWGGEDNIADGAPPDFWDARPEGRCVNKSSILVDTICFPFTADVVYVDYYTPAKLVAAELTTSYVDNVLDVPCRNQYLTKWCSTLFPACEEVVVPQGVGSSQSGEVVYAPRFVCSSICYDVAEVCAGFIPEYFLVCDPPYASSGLGDPLVNIFQTPTYTGLLPVYSSSGGVILFEQELACSNETFEADLEDFPFNCGEEEEVTTTDEGCFFSCPEPIISKSDYEDIEIMMSVVGWVSFVLSGFLILSWGMDEDKRQVPAVLPLWFFVCTNGISFVFCFGSMAGQEDFWCEDDHSPNDWGDGGCTFQGIIYVYFTLAGALWWFDICLALFCSVVLAKHDIKLTQKSFVVKGVELNVFHIVSHLVCWSLPCLSVIIALGTECIGYDGASLWCSVVDDYARIIRTTEGIEIVGEAVNWWLIGLVVIPVFLLLIASLVLVSLIAVYTVRELQQAKLVVAANWRLFCFIAIFFVIYGLTLSYQVYFGEGRDKQYDEYQDFLNCEAVARSEAFFVGHGFDIGKEITECELDQVVSEYFLGVQVFFVSAQGIFVFLIFGTAASIYTTWWAIFTCQRRPFSLNTSTSSSGAGTKTKNNGSRGIPTVTGESVKNPPKKLALGEDSMMDYSSDASSGESDSTHSHYSDY